jgi:hypothetical protein
MKLDPRVWFCASNLGINEVVPLQWSPVGCYVLEQVHHCFSFKFFISVK